MKAIMTGIVFLLMIGICVPSAVTQTKKGKKDKVETTKQQKKNDGKKSGETAETKKVQEASKQETPKESTTSPNPEASSSMKKSTETQEGSVDKIIGKTADGKQVYEGPKGGQYTLDAKGGKTYLSPEEKKSIQPVTTSDKSVGKTKDGKTIYQGPKGGRYYINDKGVKVYVKK